MIIDDLIAYHVKAAEAVEAYANVDMKERDREHYAKRAKWHRDAAKLLLDLSQSD